MRNFDQVRRRAGKAPLAVLYLLPIVASAAFVAICASRSDALDRAHALLRHANDPKTLAHAHRLACEHLARQPWSRPAARVAAVTLSRLDYPQQAEAFYARCDRLSLDDAHTRAYAILRSNDREGALVAYQHILSQWPGEVRALRLSGGIYFSRRQYAEALQIARRLQKTDAGAAEGHRLEATIEHDTGSPEEAAQHYLEYLRRDPSLQSLEPAAHPAFWLNFGGDMLAAGRAAEAIPLLEQTLSKGESAVVRTVLGKAMRLSGNDRAAEQQWRAAIVIDPNLAAPWLELGKLLLARDDAGDALDCLRHAAALAPGNDEILFALAQALRRTGNNDGAWVVEEQLRAIRSRNPRSAGGMGAPAVESRAAPASSND